MSASPAVAIAHVPVHALDRASAAAKIVEAARTRSPLTVHLCNAYVLALASRDRRYAALLARGGLNLADGVPVAWFAARAGLAWRDRPSGVELLHEVADRGVPRGLRHYLYGSTPAVVSALADSLENLHPGIEFAGIQAPPFGPVTEAQLDELADRLALTEADILWVGLGTPKQDVLADRLRGRFHGPCVPVGAAFDFVAGSKARAPRWMRRAGLEWVHRLATEPRRLASRYLWGNVRFLWALSTTGRVLCSPSDRST